MSLQAMRVIQQQYTLQLTADLIGKACGKAFSKEEAENWTVEEYATQHYQASFFRKEIHYSYKLDTFLEPLNLYRNGILQRS